ncbi:MAG: M50 family metallopeptidase [Anaerolineales bacterium]
MDIGGLSLILFIGIFSLLIILHELGHFIFARLGKMEVEEFGFGIPPRVLRLWRMKGHLQVGQHSIEIPRNYELPVERQALTGRGVEVVVEPVGEKLVLRSMALAATEGGQYTAPAQDVTPLPDGRIQISGIARQVSPGTEFTLNALPLGGFVRLKGENDPNVNEPGGYYSSNPWARLAMIAAGPVMNILVGVIAYIFLFAQTGIPITSEVLIAEVQAQSPAAAAGLQPNDRILSIAGQPIESIADVRGIVYSRLDQPTDLLIQRAGQELTVTLTPSSQRAPDQGAMGVLLGNPIRKTSFAEAVGYGTAATGVHIYTLLTLPAQAISGAITPEEGRLVGLKGIYDFTYQSVQRDIESRQTLPASTDEITTSAETPTYYTLMLLITLTLSLGVFNLLPIPALDGGRIVFLLPELIFRRRVPPNIETATHSIGFLLLIGLMIYINLMDFINPATIQLP